MSIYEGLKEVPGRYVSALCTCAYILHVKTVAYLSDEQNLIIHYTGSIHSHSCCVISFVMSSIKVDDAVMSKQKVMEDLGALYLYVVVNVLNMYNNYFRCFCTINSGKRRVGVSTEAF